jgi:hypothetical protein
MIQTDVQKIFRSAGIENPNPSVIALKEMRISRRRFRQLLENKHTCPITLGELACIKGWIFQLKEVDAL